VYNHPATTELYTLSLHDALPIFPTGIRSSIAGTGEITRCKGANIPRPSSHRGCRPSGRHRPDHRAPGIGRFARISCLRSEFDERSEEHTSELQSRENLVCRLLLE